MTTSTSPTDASILDAATTYDPEPIATMRDHLMALPAQAREAWDAASAFALPEEFSQPSDVVLLGMGGSAIGGDIIATIALRSHAVPIRIVRNYVTPPTSDSSLVIACSFSGGTEETLEAFAGALDAPGHNLAITTGGPLAAIAEERGAPVFSYEWGGPPRTALGYGVFAPLALLAGIGAIDLDAGEPGHALAALERCASRYGPDVPLAANEAKSIAASLAGRLPVIIGSDFLEVAARRWATDINENAKQWAFPLALPELNHNQLEGMGAPAGAIDRLFVVLLDAPSVHERNATRVGLTQEVLAAAGVAYHAAVVGGESPLDAVLQACTLGSWVSLYLAVLNGVDPAPTPTMDAVKARLNAS
jgi:glucose/mannose-6-phosphate isomerase